jgi:hypothetical protein
MPAKETTKVPPAERAQNSYLQLSHAAAELNAASDGLGEAVSVFDAALKRLNLGISSWVQVSGGEDEHGEWWGRYIGYAKIGNEWGVSIKDASGNYAYPEEDTVEKWRFNDAPRWMRIDCMAKIVDVLEALIKQAEDTTKKLRARTDEALELASAMSKALEQSTEPK